ncbi:MAG: M23 family metallopeptidase [Desulfobacteraceae bacterium]|nr:MAG: M23 family metallopeptidase [Desulfobacteraceae bacterium]
MENGSGDACEFEKERSAVKEKPDASRGVGGYPASPCCPPGMLNEGTGSGMLEILLTAVCADWPVSGDFTSGFGIRKSPFTGRKEFHEGIDIAAGRGTPIFAPAEGIVESVGRLRGYGLQVSIEHGHGLVTSYSHLKKILVKAGQKVRKGQKIALVGNTGRSSGPHLHYEVRLNGVPLDPLGHRKEVDTPIAMGGG